MHDCIMVRPMTTEYKFGARSPRQMPNGPLHRYTRVAAGIGNRRQ